MHGTMYTLEQVEEVIARANGRDDPHTTLRLLEAELCLKRFCAASEEGERADIWRQLEHETSKLENWLSDTDFIRRSSVHTT